MSACALYVNPFAFVYNYQRCPLALCPCAVSLRQESVPLLHSRSNFESDPTRDNSLQIQIYSQFRSRHTPPGLEKCFCTNLQPYNFCSDPPTNYLHGCCQADIGDEGAEFKYVLLDGGVEAEDAPESCCRLQVRRSMGQGRQDTQ